MLVIRVLISAIAVALIAWFVLGAREARELGQATTIAQAANISGAQARHADQLLDSAGQLNPDREVAVTRAAVALDRNHLRQARTILLRTVRAEPENAVAWDLLVQAASNGAVRARAYLALTKLQPPLPAHH